MPRSDKPAIDPQDDLDQGRQLLETGRELAGSDSRRAHAYAHVADVYVRLANAQQAVNTGRTVGEYV